MSGYAGLPAAPAGVGLRSHRFVLIPQPPCFLPHFVFVSRSHSANVQLNPPCGFTRP